MSEYLGKCNYVSSLVSLRESSFKRSTAGTFGLPFRIKVPRRGSFQNSLGTTPYFLYESSPRRHTRTGSWHLYTSLGYMERKELQKWNQNKVRAINLLKIDNIFYCFISGIENKAYILKVGSVKIPVYCHMTSVGLGACGGGGWTLDMTTDGTKVYLISINRSFFKKSSVDQDC